MPLHPNLRLATVALSTVLVAGACESGDDDTQAKADYLREADAICAEYDDEIDALLADVDFDDLDQMAAALDEVAAAGEAGVEQLRGLTPPDTDADDAAAVVDLIDDQVATIRDAAAAAADGDEAALEAAFETGGEQDDELTELAREVGFETCGGGDDAAADEGLDEEALDDGDAAGQSFDSEAVVLASLAELEQELGLGVDFQVVADEASFAEDSTPAPVESAAYETADGVVFELFVYGSPDERSQGVDSLRTALADYEFDVSVALSGSANVATIVVGDGQTAELISDYVAQLELRRS